jgi:flagellar hook-associated protein 1 FlgK
MSKISSVLDIGKRSLMNSQTALQTVSHNVASKNVEGYSRQRVEMETMPPENYGGLQVGTGARTKNVTRTVNDHIEKQIEQEQSRLGTREGEADNLSRVENLFNEQLQKGMNQFVTEFFNAFRELSNSPDNQATRELVSQTGDTVMEQMHGINRQLKSIQADIDGQTKSQVQEINSMLAECAKLNEKIQQIEFTGAPANDERDRRDQLLKDLGQRINIRYTIGSNGKCTVTAGSSAVLVTGGEHAELSAVPTGEGKFKREGNTDIFIKYGTSTPLKITDQITGGRLGGALNVRDHVINELLDKMDRLAYGMADKVNKAHAMGYDRYGNTGRGFFVMPTQVRDASAEIQVRGDIKKDVWKIAAAGMPDAPGDNRVANLISSLQYQKFMDNGNSTFNDFYNGVVSDMAVKIHHANDLRDYQQNVLEQLKNVRENISGVNLDEEMVKMIEYQKAFDASARLIRTADEMLGTVMDIKKY